VRFLLSAEDGSDNTFESFIAPNLHQAALARMAARIGADA
jgi:hypothetical protein